MTLFTLVWNLYVIENKWKKLRFRLDVYMLEYVFNNFLWFLETFPFWSALLPSVKENFSTEQKRELAYLRKGLWWKWRNTMSNLRRTESLNKVQCGGCFLPPCFSQPFSVICRVIYAVRGCHSNPFCCTLCCVHTAFTNTRTLRRLTFINVYDKLMVDCSKNMMEVYLSGFFQKVTLFSFCVALLLSMFLQSTQHVFNLKLLNHKEVTYTWAPFQLYLTEPSLGSGPAVLHGMTPALEGPAEFCLSALPCNLFCFNLWHWNALSFLSCGKLTT